MLIRPVDLVRRGCIKRLLLVRPLVSGDNLLQR